MDGISSSLNGMNDAAARLSKAAQNIADAGNENANVDLTKEIVDSKLASVLHEANAKALKVQLDNEKRLMDILA